MAEDRAFRMRAMQVAALGQPLALREVARPAAGPGEVLLRVLACGVNFADTLLASGRYQEKPAPPFTPGMEVCGVVEALGPGVAAPGLGARVACFAGLGGLAEYRRGAGGALRSRARGHGGRGGGGLSRRLRHQPPGARLSRRAASGRDPAGARRLRRGRADRGGARPADGGAGDRRRPRRGEARRRRGRRRAPRDRRRRRPPRGGEGARRSGCRLRSGRGRGVRRRAARGAAGRAAAAARLRQRRGAADPGEHPAGQEPDRARALLGRLRRARSRAPSPRASRRSSAWWRQGRLQPHVSHVLPLERAKAALGLLRAREATGKVVVAVSGPAYSAAMRSAPQP